MNAQMERRGEPAARSGPSPATRRNTPAARSGDDGDARDALLARAHIAVELLDPAVLAYCVSVFEEHLGSVGGNRAALAARRRDQRVEACALVRMMDGKRFKKALAALRGLCDDGAGQLTVDS